MNPEDIKRVRLRLGWSQERFARELGVSFSTVNRWERGRTSPSPMALKVIKGLDNANPPPPPVDRRGAVRLKKRFPARVLSAESGRGAGDWASAMTEDISITGLMLRCPQYVRAGEMMRVDLLLDNDVRASMLSKVVWTEGCGSGRNVGVRFDRVASSEMTKVINAMLKH